MAAEVRLHFGSDFWPIGEVTVNLVDLALEQFRVHRVRWDGVLYDVVDIHAALVLRKHPHVVPVDVVSKRLTEVRVRDGLPSNAVIEPNVTIEFEVPATSLHKVERKLETI